MEEIGEVRLNKIKEDSFDTDEFINKNYKFILKNSNFIKEFYKSNELSTSLIKNFISNANSHLIGIFGELIAEKILKKYFYVIKKGKINS